MPPAPTGRDVHVVGLLGTTNVEQDWWIITDFLIWRELLADAADRRWLAGANLQQPMGVILGDPYADRLNFTLSTEGITFPPILMELLQDFLEALSDVVQRASEEDVVVLVICAHGQPGGDICLGGGQYPVNNISKGMIEKALRHLRVPRERVFIVSTACYSGSWRSPRWTLLAAAEEDQESDAMRESGSNECRGGFFTFAILAEMADEQGLAVPLCEELGLGEGELGEADRLQFAFTDSFDVVLRHPPTPGNLRDSAARRVLQTPRRSLVEAKKFMEQFRDRVGGIYKFTTFVMDPASRLPLEFPVRFFDSTFLDRFHIVGPSPPDNTSSRTPDTPTSELSEDEPVPLNPVEADELIRLATAYKSGDYPATASNFQAKLDSSKLLAGFALSIPQQRALLSRLRYHARACRRAAAIAAFLEWTPAEPVTKWNKKTGLTRINEAERAGVKIRESFVDDTADGAWVGDGQPLWRTLGPGEWLAEAWAEAGKPTLDGKTWGDALSCGDESAGRS
ncbi:hypothetical protein B0H17DRAFT_688477 [Mycena rosella]|uniref:Uncharacterized protein n=1 Tax=Mycena rosella TaxID=1033263 RepID=A0AAD7DB36_MYCRO|nr:hypothetical protein B0H17DRAFT_688477 [Mycena rosella]